MIRPALAGLLLATAAAAQPVLPRLEPARLGDAPAPAVHRDAAPERAATPDAWLGRDKALHAGGSFLTTLAGQYVLTDKGTLSNGEALPVAAGATLALGLAKEVLDSQRPRDPHFCWRDLAADAAGVALAALVVGL